MENAMSSCIEVVKKVSAVMWLMKKGDEEPF
jgi:hypothetical protein